MNKKNRKIIVSESKLHKIIENITNPLVKKFRFKNLVQVIVGATILAIPVGFTEETWKLGETLPLPNIFGILSLSILFILIFAYRNYQKNMLKIYRFDFTKRVVLTYTLSFIIVAILLTLIGKAPWATDWLLAFKRVVIVTFPASMSAAIADTLS
jgi:uncharacterized membrane protein